MLPDIHLDRMSFDEMVEQAKNRIVSFYPEWTDFNYHDPGITLIELFAWRKEIQQYELDHIGEWHKRKYLQLLGTDIRHRSAAECFVTVKTSSPCLIAEGCRLEAAGVIFETGEKQMLPGVSITHCFGWLENMVSFLDGERLNLGQPFCFYPFGSKAREGTSLYIGLSGPLPVGERVALTIQVDRQNGFLRNPVHKDSIPLAGLCFSYWDGTQYQPVELIREETFGFLLDGQIVFQVNSRMQECEVGEEKGYFLRVLLKENGYEAAPVISFMDMNTIWVQQKETVAKWLTVSKEMQDDILWGEHYLCAAGEVRVFAENRGHYKEIPILEKEPDTATGRTRIRLDRCEEDLSCAEGLWILAYSKEDWYRRHSVLGIGHGFPNECFDLDEDRLSYEDLELLIEEAECPGIYQKWEKREDFAASGPEDAHYCVDSMTGRILFGNGIHGMAPEGRILLVSYARVLGGGGNIKASRIQSLRNQNGEEIRAFNRWDACGGEDEETVEEAFARVRGELMQPKNLVTAQDYEQMVRATPGLCIESCKALFGSEKNGRETGQTVRIVVKPYSLEPRPGLTSAFIQNILRHLEKKRLLGVRIKVIPPLYFKLSVFVETVAHPQYQGAESMVEQAVKEYLTILTEQFGGMVSYSSLYGYIDRLDCVAGVRSLVLEAKDNGVSRNPYGDLIFPSNGIADEIDVRCSCSFQG
ncbi:MAG: baseplate J/gp47 family protein [Lachnospiraceae bacterium]|nr:baseplate J/gp47 family protein [Lachnospiraceae bacterium]